MNLNLAAIKARRAAVKWSSELNAIPDWQTLEFRRVQDKYFIANAPADIDALIEEIEQQGNALQRVIALCEDKMVEGESGSLTDADTLWPSEVLDVLYENQGVLRVAEATWRTSGIASE